ncbi:MAG: PAS domain S-box protein [Thermonemataceae bacterium]
MMNLSKWNYIFSIILFVLVVQIGFTIVGEAWLETRPFYTRLYQIWQVLLQLLLIAYAYFLFLQQRSKSKAQLKRFTAWMNLSEDAIVVIDRHWQVLLWNECFQRHYASHIALHKNILALLPTTFLGDWRDALQEAFDGQTTTLTITPSEQHPFEEVIFYPTQQQVVVLVKRWAATHPSNLLEEIQQHNEELKAQEEELRQNLEELQATQDEMLVLQEELRDKEANLVALIDNLDDAMVSVDFKYKILSMNRPFQAYYEAKGLSVQRGMNYLRLIPEALVAQRKKYVDKALEGNKFTVDEQIEEAFFELHYNPIYSQDGVVIGVAIFAQNVTKFKENERVKQKLISELEARTKALKDRERKLKISLEELRLLQKELLDKNEELTTREARVRSVIDNASDGIMAIDKDYNITLINKLLQDQYGDKGIDIGCNVFTLIPPEQIPHWKAVCDKALKGEVVNTIDQIQNRFIEVALSPIYDRDNIIGVAILTRDVSRQVSTDKSRVKTIDLMKRIQERATDFSKQQESEIDDYRKKVEQLKKEIRNLKS